MGWTYEFDLVDVRNAQSSVEQLLDVAREPVAHADALGKSGLLDLLELLPRIHVARQTILAAGREVQQVRVEVVDLELAHLFLDGGLQILHAGLADLGEHVHIGTLEPGRLEKGLDAFTGRLLVGVHLGTVDEAEAGLERHGDLLGGGRVVQRRAGAERESGELDAGGKADGRDRHGWVLLAQSGVALKVFVI